ncbi:MAG: insulinase family protein, partial [Thiovulaceae bacterium]|nr:insulinase family protein [Sulfurimonadaceae bacterium]
SDLPSIPSENEIIKFAESAKNETLAPFSSSKIDKNFYNFDDLKGSKIVKEVVNDKYQGREWTLSNGIKVYWTQIKDTTSNYNLVAESPGGLVKVAGNDVASAKMLRNAGRYKNLGKLNENETKLFLSTKNAAVSSDLSLYNERIMGSSSRSDIELMMQMVYLSFKGLDLQKEGYDKMIKKQIEFFDKEPSDNTKYIDSVQFVKYNSNLPRQIKLSDLANVSLEKMNKVYTERFGNALDFKFFISGPESADAIKPLVEKYIGSLPVNKNLEKPSTGGVDFVKGETGLKFYTKSIQTPISSIDIIYSGKAAYTAKNYIASYLLKHILTDRYLKSIREDKGGTYYVGVGANLMSEPQNRLSLEINFDTDPKMREELLKLIGVEIQDIVKNGPKNEEFNAALLFLKKSFADASVRKSYLSERYYNLISDGVDLNDRADAILNTIKPADVKNLAAELIKQGNRMLFVFGTE